MCVASINGCLWQGLTFMNRRCDCQCDGAERGLTAGADFECGWRRAPAVPRDFDAINVLMAINTFLQADERGGLGGAEAGR